MLGTVVQRIVKRANINRKLKYGKESRYIAIGAFYPYLNKNLLLGAIFSNLEFDDSISNYVYKRSLLTKILRGLNCCHTPDLLMYIMTIGVIDEVRRMGIGSALIDQCAKVAKERMPLCKGISLHVIEYNRAAINFYIKKGYKKISKISDYYKIHGKYYDGYKFGILFEDPNEVSNYIMKSV